MIRPTAYLAPMAWYEGLEDEARIELCESFPKQTFRNRCIILQPDGSPITLSVPVCKVEHKQLTRDVQISYQTRWQHQHWIALVSAYKHTPFFDYYQEFFHPFYEKETKFLVDLNAGLDDVIRSLMRNERPKAQYREAINGTTDWQGLDLEIFWGDGISVVDSLFKKGPFWND